MFAVSPTDRSARAPTLTSTGGVTAGDTGPISGGLRLGSRAANETGSVVVRGHTVFELFGRWSLSRIGLLMSVDNLFDVAWNEAQFATTSRLRDEPSTVTELHFTPGAGRAVQVGVDYTF